MNSAYLHLLTNHLPVIGIIFSVLISLFALLNKSETTRKLALYFVVLVSLTALPAFFTGEPAEELIEDSPGISHDLIHEHEEASELATIVICVTGVLALITLIVSRRKPAFIKQGLQIVLVFSLASALLMGKAAIGGGKIKHDEIRTAN